MSSLCDDFVKGRGGFENLVDFKTREGNKICDFKI